MNRVDVRGHLIDIDTFPTPFDDGRSLVSLNVNGFEVILEAGDARRLAAALSETARDIDGG